MNDLELSQTNKEYIDKMVELLKFQVRSNYIYSSLTENDKLVKYLGNAPIVNIPEGVKIVGQNAFKDKTHITDVTFPDGLEFIDSHAFERCIGINNLVLPETLKTIGDKAFMRCYSLSYIAFNDSLESIGEESFEFLVNRGINNLYATTIRCHHRVCTRH